jgi:ribosomal protein S14
MKNKKVIKNLKLIKNYYNNELIFLFYKSLYTNNNISFFFRTFIYYKYIIKFESIKLKMGCLITHRMRSKYSFFNISRVKIRDLAAYKLLTGIRKSS